MRHNGKWGDDNILHLVKDRKSALRVIKALRCGVIKRNGSPADDDLLCAEEILNSGQPLPREVAYLVEKHYMAYILGRNVTSY